MATALRICIHGVRAPEARSYHVQVRCIPKYDGVGAAPTTNGSLARTENSEVTNVPTFINHVFALRTEKRIRPGFQTPSILSLDLYAKLPPVASSDSAHVKDRYEAVASGVVDLDADQASKLSAGGRVNLTAKLESASGKSTGQYRVSLELIILDKPTGQNQLNLSTAASASENCCILVARATSLPKSSSGAGNQNPSCFVLVSTSKDRAKNRPSRAMTMTIPNERNPTWEEYVFVDISGLKMSKDNLEFKVVDDSCRESILECSLPLSAFQPGPHYNLHLTSDEDEPDLYISVQFPPTCWLDDSDEESDDEDDRLWIAVSILEHQVSTTHSNPIDGLIAQLVVQETAASAEVDFDDEWFVDVDITAGDMRKELIKSFKGTHLGKKTRNVDVVLMEGERGKSLWPYGHEGVLCESDEAKFLFVRVHQLIYDGSEEDDTFVGEAMVDLSKVRNDSSGAVSSLGSFALVDREGCDVGNLMLQINTMTTAALRARKRDKEHLSEHRQPAQHRTSDSQQSTLLDILIADMDEKQNAFEAIQRGLDLSEGLTQLQRWRLDDAEKKKRYLAQELSHMQNLLQEERKASRSPQVLENLGHLAINDEETMQYVTSVVAALGQERRKNRDVVHKLQQLHAEHSDAVKSRSKYAELEEAHFAQAKLIRGMEDQLKRVSTYKGTIKRQEQVIRELQGVLVGGKKWKKDSLKYENDANLLKKTNEALEKEIDELKRVKGVEEISTLRSQLDVARTNESKVRIAREEHEQERLEAMMRWEKAEATAIAAQNELLETTKRYAREAAQLKARLAEKDAQLMGGFGALSSIGFHDDFVDDPVLQFSKGIETLPPLVPLSRQSSAATRKSGAKISLEKSLSTATTHPETPLGEMGHAFLKTPSLPGMDETPAVERPGRSVSYSIPESLVATPKKRSGRRRTTESLSDDSSVSSSSYGSSEYSRSSIATSRRSSRTSRTSRTSSTATTMQTAVTTDTSEYYTSDSD
ncbi:hypothetical protein BSKO_11395 [Bryopsis sp. KO-2023]|nr:hypothetical protein BSKO_11395 [Bryopsis sp. KO-2023]